MISCRYFVSAAAFLGLACAAPLASSIDKRDYHPGDCTNGPWSGVQFIGGKAANGFCETSWKTTYSPLAGVEFWTTDDGDHIAGIQAIYADGGRGQVWGTTATSSDHPSATFNLAPGELITNLISYGNGKGKYYGAVHIETNKGQKFDAGKKTDGLDPYPQNVGGSGNGILYGFEGNFGDGDDNTIVNLAWLFLNEKIESVEVTDVKYDSKALEEAASLKPKTFDMGTYYNHFDSNVTVAQDRSRSVKNTNTWSQSSITTFNVGYSLTVKAEPLNLGLGTEETITAGFSTSQEQTSGGSAEEDYDLNCKISAVPLKPKQGVKLTGTFAHGEADIPYDSTVNVNLANGSKFSYGEKGTIKSVQYSACKTTVEASSDSSADDPPKETVNDAVPDL